MITIGGYKTLEDLKDQEFYKKVNVGKINEPFEGGHVALDCFQRIIVIETNPDRARARAIILGCEYPRILDSGYFGKEFYREHNKRLEKALSNKKTLKTQ